VEQKAVTVLSMPVYAGFGPTLAAEYLENKHGIKASKETVRKWMIGGKLWRAKKEKVKQIHVWRPRRSRFGELVQWDTSEHDWLEGRGERLYLIAMIDDATSRLFARFVRHDSTDENMKLLWSYLARSSTSNRQDVEARTFTGALGVLAALREVLLPAHSRYGLCHP